MTHAKYAAGKPWTCLAQCQRDANSENGRGARTTEDWINADA